MTDIKRRRGGAPNHELRTISSALSPPLPPLDLVHVTAVGAARDIVLSGQIDMRTCNVFQKELVYFFVARPCYKLKQGDQKTEQINRFPFVFVVSPDKLGPPFHIYPFDTGAAIAGVFDDFADPYVFLEDYELDPTLNAATAHIQWAFEDFEAYFDGDLRIGLADTLKDWQTVGKGFIRIAGLATSQSNRPDKRASAVEVAYRCNVPLKGNTTLAIIPKQYLESGSDSNKQFMDRLKALGVEWDTYDWQPNTPPNFYLDEITHKVRAHLKKGGQI
jgi:hypothetical protein